MAIAVFAALNDNADLLAIVSRDFIHKVLGIGYFRNRLNAANALPMAVARTYTI